MSTPLRNRHVSTPAIDAILKSGDQRFNADVIPRFDFTIKVMLGNGTMIIDDWQGAGVISLFRFCQGLPPETLPDSLVEHLRANCVTKVPLEVIGEMLEQFGSDVLRMTAQLYTTLGEAAETVAKMKLNEEYRLFDYHRAIQRNAYKLLLKVVSPPEADE